MAAPHDPPPAAELVAAVRAFLAGGFRSPLDGWARYQLRVAANVLAVVERELALGAAQASAHAAVLAQLDVEDEAELARAIRSGRLDDRRPEVVAAVRDTVRAKLEVANPAHLEGDPT